jgi:hypothetical protein
MLEFPRSLVSAGVIDWALVTPGQDARANLAGQPQTLYPSGGPFWTLGLDQLVGDGRDGVMALRRFKLALGNGQTPAIIRPCDCRQIPASPAGAAVVATIGAAAARSTTVALTVVSGGRALRPGDQFSPTHAAWGLRMYRIVEDLGAGAFKIRPPLREAVTAGQAVDFNEPGVVMRLDGAFSLQRIGFRPTGLVAGKARFVELERPIA